MQKFREMVSYVTRYADLRTIQIFPERPSPPSGIPPQQISLKEIYDGRCTAVRLTKTEGPTSPSQAIALGARVEAHSLVGASHLNGFIGKVTAFQGDRIGVDFGSPHGVKALQAANLLVLPTDADGPQSQQRPPQPLPPQQHQQQQRTYEQQFNRQPSFGSPDTGVPYVNCGAEPATSPARASQPAPKPVPKRDAKFQKAGGSQLAFMRLMSMNKNPVGPLEPGQILNAAEVAKHTSPADCWIIYNGKVYDVTPYMKFHPGGKDQLMRGAGQDCTQLFNESHSWVSIDGLIGMLCLGKLVK